MKHRVLGLEPSGCFKLLKISQDRKLGRQIRGSNRHAADQQENQLAKSKYLEETSGKNCKRMQRKEEKVHEMWQLKQTQAKSGNTDIHKT